MNNSRHHTANLPVPERTAPTCRLIGTGGYGLFILLLVLLSPPILRSQSVPETPWRYDTIDATVGFDLPSAFSPRVSFDRYGVRHHTWVSRDPTSAGLQIYHSDDASGRIGAPFLLSDTGTVYDFLNLDTVSYITLPDPDGILHTLFLANVPEVGGLDIGLYYVNNREPDLEKGIPVRLTIESGRYALAVDSLGTAHAVWLLSVPEGIEVRYWNSLLQPGTDYALDTIPARSFPAWIGSPVLEADEGNLHLFVRNDSGKVYYGRYPGDGTPGGLQQLLIPPYMNGPGIPSQRSVNFRLRGALDTDGAWHLLVPRRGDDRLLHLHYLTNAGGLESSRVLVQTDSTLLGFDIRASGTGRVAGVWTGYRGRFVAERPRTGYVEFVRTGPGIWREEERVDDIDALVGNSAGEWRIAGGLDLFDNRVVVALARRPGRSAGGVQGVGYLIRRSPELRVRSLIPDAAAPGMSLVVELYADYRDRGMFGLDTLDPQNVRVETVNPVDQGRLIVGPSIVSWNGRLLSTMLFIDPDAPPGPVQLRIRIGDRVSSEFTFSIVEPQRLGPGGDGHLEGGGVLGSGGIFGERTRGGVIVVDSLILKNGVYSVSTEDVDPSTPGNEGMLPVTILARGTIRIDSTATLSVSAPPPFLPTEFGTAGPGGGGGGGGMGEGGGEGVTGGGLPGDSLSQSIAPGSGSLRSSIAGGGASHVGTPGGVGIVGAPGGGGTGHPFGVSGRYGRHAPLYPLRPDEGGAGGGGGHVVENGFSTGGGGGGHGLRGEHGSPITRNGGEPIGSPVLVPLSGGSGGGGGTSLRGHAAGGGGGGALALYAERSLALFGRIEADGGDGYTGQISINASGGGGGSGGGVLIGAQGGIVLGGNGAVSVLGGRGSDIHGPEGEKGGHGGSGRVRVDGRIDLLDTTVRIERLSAGYFALATDMSGSFQVDDSIRISGTGIAGRRIRIYSRRGEGGWSYGNPRETIVDTAGVWGLKIATPGSGRIYIAAMERVEEGDPGGSPSWIMSTAGGLIIGTPDAEIDVDEVDFGCVDFGTCDTARVWITNTGTQSDLLISNPEIIGGGGWFLIGEFSPLRIPPGMTGSIRLRFCPSDTGSREALLRFTSNVRPDSIHIVDLSGCGRAGELQSMINEFDLGSLCPGDCRDTLLTLRNVGNASLDVKGLAPADSRLAVQILSPSLPIRIEPGGSANVRVRVCLRGGTGDFAATFQATTPRASMPILFLIENQGPLIEIPTSTPTLLRDRGKSDTCPILQIRLKNARTDLPMAIVDLLPRSTSFTVISPSVGRVLAPMEEIELLLRFCGENPGEYPDTLDLTLESGSCRIDTLVPLHGSVIRSLPELSLEVAEKIDFGKVPVGRTSAPRRVVIRNSGEGWGRGIVYRLQGIAPTGDGEFAVVPDFSPPADLRGRSEFGLDVSAIPGTTGLRSGRLIVQTETGSWIDTVELCAEGIEPGVVADYSVLDFPAVRRGGRVVRELRFFNLGNSSDRLDRVTLDDSTRFFIVGYAAKGTPSTLPVTLRPVEDTLVTTIMFDTDEVGRFSDTLRGYTSEGTEVVVVLNALSGLERGVLDRSLIRFACDSSGEGIEEVTITNAGSWELKITRLWFEGADSASFTLLDIPGPDLLDPGDSRTYRIAYRGGERPASAILRVEQSGPDLLSVRLDGEACAPEIMEIVLNVPELTGYINTPLTVPLQLRTPVSLPEGMTLQIALRYDPRSLMPKGEDPVRGVVATDVEGDEEVPGEMIIEAKVPAGTGQGTLLEIDMMVLLGARYQTPLDIEILPSSIPPRYLVVIENGMCTTVDCDTSGTIDLGGVYGIKQSHPNPGGGIVRIPFEIARSEQVTITLFNARGEIERILLDQHLDAGRHELKVDVSTLSAGLYYYEIRSGRYREVRRMGIEN